MSLRALFLPIAGLILAPSGALAAQLPEIEPVSIRGPSHALAYVESSTGITPPTLDGGNTEIEMGDVNGDGHPDLVSIGDHGSPHIGTDQHGLTVWLGDGLGHWSAVQTGNFGYGGVALGDVDWDGFVDAGYGMHHDYSATDLGDQLLEVARGDGTGAGWTPWDDGLATSGETYGMFAADFADVDNDGDLDLGAGSFGCCSGTHVYRNHGDGSWSQSFGFLGGNSTNLFFFADFDGDGNADLAGGNSLGNVFLGDGTGGFLPATGNLPSSSTIGMSAGDVDGDGADELAFVASGGSLQVRSWRPGNLWVPLAAGLPASSPAQATQLLDLDLDGAVDLLSYGKGVIAVHRGHGTGWWTLAWGGATPGTGSKNSRFLRAGADLDHNGYPDLVLVEQVSTGLFASENRARVYREAAPAAALSIHLVEPGKGRTWIGGQARFVRWTAAVPGAQAASVAIELSTSGPAGPWVPLAAGLPNGGTHQLVVPAGIASEHCHLRLSIAIAGQRAAAVGPAFRIRS